MGPDYAVMRWLDDGNRLSVHSLKQVVEPKLPLEQYKAGMCGLSLYRGFPGMWKFRILKAGAQKEMTKWLDSNLEKLMFDVSDKFCEGDSTDSKGKSAVDSEETKITAKKLKLGRSPLKSENSTGDSTDNKRKSAVDSEETKITAKKLKMGRSPLKSENSTGDSTDSKRKSVVDSEETAITPRKPKLGRSPLKSENSTGDSTDSKWKSAVETEETEITPRKPKLGRSPLKAENSTVKEGETTEYLRRGPVGNRDSFGDRIKTLEEEVKNLRRKNRKLTERVTKLEEGRNTTITCTPKKETTCTPKATPKEETIGTPKQKPTCTPEVQTSKLGENCFTEEELKKKIANVTGDQAIFKELCSSIFTEDELKKHTRTGKRTIKCLEDAKPQFNPQKFNLLQKMVTTYTSYDKATFFKKLENFQKVLRRV